MLHRVGLPRQFVDPIYIQILSLTLLPLQKGLTLPTSVRENYTYESSCQVPSSLQWGGGGGSFLGMGESMHGIVTSQEMSHGDALVLGQNTTV